MVSAGTYRAPGQCQKKHGLRLVKLIDQRIPACAHHRAVLEKSGILVRKVGR